MFSLALLAIYSRSNAQSSTLTVSSGCSLTVNNATVKIGGAVVSQGGFNATNGTVEFNGTSSQTIPSGTFYQNTIKDLIISNDVSLLGEDSITGSLSMTGSNKTFYSNGYLTLRSTPVRTASVTDLTSNNTYSGNKILGDVSVEKYIAAQKKWRFLSIPTNSLQTIKQSWQEGCAANINCIPGYGTQITGPGGTTAGFDLYTATPSIKTYNSVSNSFVSVPNTNSLSINNESNNTVSYFAFVRGDRNAITYSSPVTATTLRTRGPLKQDLQQPITISSPATSFTAVGNPYASRINLRNMTPPPSFTTRIYVWDPLATIGCAYGTGAYQTLTFDGTDFTVTPGGGSYDSPYNADPNSIESGEAFFVGGQSTDYNIIFKENIKQNLSVARTTTNTQFIKVQLFANINGTSTMMDGIKADIGSMFSNNIDDADAFKISNSTENVSIKRNGKLLSVERHNTITVNDTIQLSIGNMRVQDYKFQVELQNLEQPNLVAYLEDSYLNTSVPLNHNMVNSMDFKILNAAPSYAANRFRIVFKQAVVLPVTVTSIKAYPKNKFINIEWHVENEINMKQYEVEKSVDGMSFTPLTSILARGNNNSAESYVASDVQPQPGYNYYRIKIVNLDGHLAYTNIVKVLMGNAKEEISIYPNPLVNNMLSIQLNSALTGKYYINIYNSSGQQVMRTSIDHAAGNSTELISLDKNLTHAVYNLEIIKPDNSVFKEQVIY